MQFYPKRLIEVDLPIRRISAHARREKSIRHGHISTLHIWWARRPLAACRAVLCAALWPDPLDEHCPQAFRDAAALALCRFAEQVRGDTNLANLCTEDTWRRWNRTTPAILRGDNPASWPDLRLGLLDFIADFANWDASTVPAYLETARLLTHVAHISLTDPTFHLPTSQPADSLQSKIQNLKSEIHALPRPLVVDPFAGGGAIPLEALRVGADAFASDLNPVAVLLNKVVLEYIPKYGQRLADEVQKWGQWIEERAEKELAEFYPKDPRGATPIAFLWARTIHCEGPGCGAEVPLMRGLWLAKKGEHSVGLRLMRNHETREIGFDIIEKRPDGWFSQSEPMSRIQNPKLDGTVARGSATCPLCGYTTPVASVRRQLKERRGGAADARLIAIRQDDLATGGRAYRLPTERDIEAVRKSMAELERRKQDHTGLLSMVPDEPLPPQGTLGFRIQLYGMKHWGDLFTPRQLLALTTLTRLIQEVSQKLAEEHKSDFASAVQLCLALVVDRLADFNSSLCMLNVVGGRGVVHTFGRQALPIVWDFMETNPFNDVGANWHAGVEAFVATIKTEASSLVTGHAEHSSAVAHPLPDDACHGVFTDPPYYDAVPYADLSDFFYVWLKRTVGEQQPTLLAESLTPKAEECIVDEVKGKDRAYFERTMGHAMAEGRRVLAPEGVGMVVFAHKTTSGWEALLQAMVNAGWIITGSWPIDTERPGRLRAQNSAALASSIHLICRPRETILGTLTETPVGEWRNVLDELPSRIHGWMPHLAEEGVVGADAIFACLGPALEIYSRYARVEKASGEQVTLKEYLEQVWAAVAREALTMIFEGADTSGFEEDARLTAIWFWTLKAAANGDDNKQVATVDDPETMVATKPASGYAMEYDAARKLAQGLGVNLTRLSQPGGIVVIKGSMATLSHVSVRAQYLVGAQLSLFGETDQGRRSRRKQEPVVTLKDVEQRRMDLLEPSPLPIQDPNMPYLPGMEPTPDSRTFMQRLLQNGSTLLDRLHQAMLLHARSQTALLRPFLMETRVSDDPRFWLLAQALSALYPSQSDEKRWVDGVLARKKGLGF